MQLFKTIARNFNAHIMIFRCHMQFACDTWKSEL